MEKLIFLQLVNKFPNFMESKSLLPYLHVPILCQINPVHAPLPTNPYLEKSFYVILPSPPRFSTSSLAFRFLHKNPACHSPLQIRATCPTHLIIFNLIDRIILQYRPRSSSMHNFLQPPLTLNYLLSTPFSTTLS